MPLISIIIPAYNEAPTIEKVIERVETCILPQGFKRELIIINDGSTDETLEILKKYEDQHTVIHTENNGKGGAVRRGFSVSKGDFIVIQDADLEQDPNDFCALLEPLITDHADVAFGSRFLGSYKPISMIMSAHYLINKSFSMTTNLLTSYRLTDVWTGYKMYSRKALDLILPHLQSNGIEFELEVVVLLSKLNMRVIDIPISYIPRWYDEGKKTNWKQAIKSLYKLFVFGFRRVK